MKDPADINAELLQDFDPRLIEDKQGKRYIGHEHIRMRVIEATANQFEWHVASMDYRDDGAVRARQDKKTNEWNVPPVMIVTGTLTIPGLGSRSGTGVQVIEAGAGEDTYKAAESDAFKRAAMAFGVGLRQLYIGENVHAQQTTARATNGRPQTRQHDQNSANERAEMTDAEFDQAVRTALLNKDGRGYRSLVDQAGKYTSRWLVLIHACDTPTGLDWLGQQIEDRGMASDLLSHELAKRAKEIKA